MNVAFRTDCSLRIGTGHLMRCLTLAAALRECGVQSTFVCRHIPSTHASMVLDGGFGLRQLEPQPAGEPTALGVTQHQDAQQTLAALDGQSHDWLVVDHYDLDAEWERGLRRAAARILVIDDLADRAHDADLLLDQNLQPDRSQRYATKVAPTCRQLLGPKFALLRPQFLQARRDSQLRSGAVRRIVVFFGGADVDNCTSHALSALVRLQQPELAVDVIIGGANPHRDELADHCRRHGFTLHVQTSRMAELLRDADLAIGAGGSTTWERACVGLPSVVFAIAPNQEQLTQDAALTGLVSAPGFAITDTEAFAAHLACVLGDALLRRSMSKRGMEVVDGRGAGRVLRAMGVSPVAIRRARADDARSIHEWRNDPSVRRVSRSDAPIDWPAHRAWFDAVLADSGRVLLIGELRGRPIGVVRFDLAGDRATVSIYLVPGEQSAGAGGDLLEAAHAWLRDHEPAVRELEAEVMGQNAPSHALFASAGYTPQLTRYAKRFNR